MGIGTEMRKELSTKVNEAWLSDKGRQLKDILARTGFATLSANFKYCLGILKDEEAKSLGVNVDALKGTRTVRECYRKVREVVGLPAVYRGVWESPTGATVSKEQISGEIKF